MKGALLSALACFCGLAAHGVMGFLAPASASRVARNPTAPATATCRQSSRLCMSATTTPKFSVSLMDDTRVTFSMEKEHLSKLAEQVAHSAAGKLAPLSDQYVKRYLSQPARSTTARLLLARVLHISGSDVVLNSTRDVNAILASFKRLKANATEGGRPYREETIEYKDTIDGLNILVECNPNIFPDPFKAQVFIRIWDDKVEISSQAMLTKLTDAIKQHLATLKAQG